MDIRMAQGSVIESIKDRFDVIGFDAPASAQRDIAPAMKGHTLNTLTLEEAVKVAADRDRLAELIGRAPDPELGWRNRCHEISLALLRTGEFGRGRVARGTAEGIVGQHSWIVLGDDVYNDAAAIVDPTIDPRKIVVDYAAMLTNTPKGKGSIWAWEKPWAHSTRYVELAVPVSPEAEMFLSLIGPLDLLGWMQLADAPVEGWPAAEIIAAMLKTPELKAAVPIDIAGHLTDENPGGLYR